jgi:hypothetical protein
MPARTVVSPLPYHATFFAGAPHHASIYRSHRRFYGNPEAARLD